MVRVLYRVLLALIIGLMAIASTGCIKQAKKARHLSRGNRDFQAELYDRAEIEYLVALRIPPPDPVALARLGEIYFAQGKQPQAMLYLNEAVKLQPDNAQARLKLGFTELRFRRTKEARDQALAVLQKQPGNTEALLLLADSAVSPEELRQTEEWLLRVEGTLKAQSQYHVARGTLYVHQTAFERAEAEFKQALAQDPKSSQAYLVLGNLYALRNDLANAEPALKKAAELAPLRSNARLRYVELQLKTGAVQEAKKSIEQLTQKVPDFIPAWIFLAQVAKAEGKIADCAALAQKILMRDPVNYDGLLLKGSMFLAQGDPTNALIQFEKLVKTYGPGPQAEYELALAHLLNNQEAKAMACLSQAITVDTNFVDAILLKAKLSIHQGNPEATISPLTKLIREHPQSPQAYMLLATAYAAQNKREQATEVYRGMMNVFTNAPEIPYTLGTLLVLEGKPLEARPIFEKCLQMSPTFFAALERLVDLDLAEDHPQTAIDRVNKYIEQNPNSELLPCLIAKIHVANVLAKIKQQLPKGASGPQLDLQLTATSGNRDELKAAETCLLKAIELNPDFSPAYQLLTKIYVWSHRQQEAIQRLNSLLARTNDVSALIQIGIINEQLKEYAAAAGAYERAIKANPNSIEALNNLGFLYAEHLDQPNRAYELAQKAQLLRPDNPFTADTLGWILYKRGDWAHALPLLQESVTKLPNSSEVQYHLGMILYMLGQEQPARAALERAITLNNQLSQIPDATPALALLAIDPKIADSALVTQLEKRLQEIPNDPVALVRLAAIQERDGAFEKAAQTYRLALKNNPKNVLLCLKVIQLYQDRLNNPQQAMQVAKDAHNLLPEDSRINRALGRLAFNNKDYQWAASLLQEAARSMPDEPDMLYDLAWSHYSLGQVPEAEAKMKLILDVAHHSPSGENSRPADPHTENAERFLQFTAASKAAELAEPTVRYAQSLMTAEPNYVPAIMVSARASEQQHKFKEAAQLYQRALDLYPLFAPAAKQLALLTFEQFGDDKAAYELALKAREGLPKDPELAKVLGLLAYRRQDYSRSADLLQESTRQRTQDAEVFYWLGMARYRLNQRTQSKDALQRALDLNAPTKLALEARRIMRELN